MSCCDDPTEASKVDPRELIREQEHYGNLVRELFTGNPEKVMLRQLNEANNYLRELAALRAYYESVRLQAINLLDKNSLSILQRIVDQEPESVIGFAARQKIDSLNNPGNPLKNIINKLKPD